MSNWFQENVAKIATAWQAGMLFTTYVFMQIMGALGIMGILESTGALVLIGMCFAFTAYLFTLTKVFEHKDGIIQVTPKEQFTMKQAVSMIEETFGLKPNTKFVPSVEESGTVEPISREEFGELKDLVVQLGKAMV